jgi:hypothetical protein
MLTMNAYRPRSLWTVSFIGRDDQGDVVGSRLFICPKLIINNYMLNDG